MQSHPCGAAAVLPGKTPASQQATGHASDSKLGCKSDASSIENVSLHYTAVWNSISSNSRLTVWLWQQGASSTTAEQGLLRAMPAILRLINSALNEQPCTGVCASWDAAGSQSTESSTQTHLPGQIVNELR